MTSPSTISDSTAGAEMHGLAKKLFPICRSLTGDGVRRVLKLPESVDLEVGGMGSIPGWDSLAHINILLNLERDFGITIPSYEMEKTYTFHALVELIAEIRDTERRSLE